jgi:type II restriction enzyme
MAAALINYDERLRQAVQLFWRGRRDAATGGENLGGFRDMIEDVVHRHGPEGCEVHRGNSACVLPGFFRPTKQWDLLIVFQNRLLAAFELKSLCGPSFEDEADKCCDEAVRSGYDFRKAQGAAIFGPGASPFLGYFLLVEDAPGSREPVKAQSALIPTDKIFHVSSYQHRMRILCERMVEQQLYSCASVLVAPKESKCGDSSHLSNPTAFRFLLSRLAGHLASEADLVGGPETRFKDEPAIYESGSLLAGECFSSIEPLEKTGLTQP